MPGDERPPFAHASEARQVLNDAEQELQAWQPQLEPVQSLAESLGTNLMPNNEHENFRSPTSVKSGEFEDASATAAEPRTEMRTSTEPATL